MIGKKSITLNRRALTIVVAVSCAIAFLPGFADPFMTEISRLYLDVKRLQSHYNRELITLLEGLRHGSYPSMWWWLPALSFAYGVVHAIGPGHGKTLITTLVFTQKSGYKKALGIALGGGLCQGLSAVFWVVCTVGALQWLVRDVVERTQWVAGLSFVVTMAIGVFLMIRAGLRLRRHDQAVCCGCGHKMEKIPENINFKTCLLVIAAIGMRPCSGSIMVLSVAALWHLWLVGIIMTFALTCGTVVTVTTLAFLSVFGRERLSGASSRKRRLVQHGAHIVAFVGGAVLFLFGGAFLLMQYTQPTAIFPI